MRHHLWLLAAVPLLCFCGVAAAQQNLLTQRDDRNDPCRHFKLRILEPAGGVDYKLRVHKAPADIDPQMEWNPCLREEAPLALAAPAPTPDNGNQGLLAPGHRLVPWPNGSGRGQSSDLLRPGLPSAVEMMRRRW